MVSLNRSSFCSLLAVKRFDNKNGIAVHVHNEGHIIDWKEAKVLDHEKFYWRRRVMEAVRIQTQDTMNLDCGLQLSDLWLPCLQRPLSSFHVFDQRPS